MSWTDWAPVTGEGLDFDEIVYEKRVHEELEGGVARISINRPEKYNAVTNKTVDEMFRAFYDANHDPVIGVIVLTAIGDNFGTGGDVDWERWGLREAFYFRYPYNRLVRNSRKPIIAAVRGYCIAGANHLAYCCDFTIASETAKFGQAGPRVSSPADGFFVPYLAKVVGMKKAREMWMLCRRYSLAAWRSSKRPSIRRWTATRRWARSPATCTRTGSTALRARRAATPSSRSAPRDSGPSASNPRTRYRAWLRSTRRARTDRS
jgi:naphthoate synthase/2-ketocyclohexanecarboxyl-CoA hydrolase